MRWSEYTAKLPPEAYAQLVNLLTIGSGSVAFAVRLSVENASAAQVLRHLAGAHDSLRLVDRTVSAVLAPLFNGASGQRWGDVSHAGRLRWRELVGRLSGEQGAQLQAVLDEAAGHAREAARLVLQDAEMDEVRGSLERAVDALARARLLLPTLFLPFLTVLTL